MTNTPTTITATTIVQSPCERTLAQRALALDDPVVELRPRLLPLHETRVMGSVFPVEGGCDCGKVRYRMRTEPLVVHCCHCRWCQRESGASFALNAMIEADRVVNLGKPPEIVLTPSDSGISQRVARCPDCKLAVWSHYAGSGHLTKFVRVGTLDSPDVLPPDVHIFTISKQAWITLAGEVPAYDKFYDRNDVWSPKSLGRIESIRAEIETYRASLEQSQT